MKPSVEALYLDTSCLLKLFLREPESARVAELLDSEDSVVLSELGILEAETQLRARLLGGLLTKARYSRLGAELQRTLTLEPFSCVPFPQDGFERARSLAARTRVHSRTLDLLHLAAMEALGVTRLLTNDSAQAAVANALGFQVVSPT